MRSDLPVTWDERGTLTSMLDYVRQTVRAKCVGVSESDARAAPLPTSPLMSISGVVSHVRWVEYAWFQVRFLGEDDHGPWTKDDPDRELHFQLDLPMAELLDAYDEQCERYRQLVARTDLDVRSAAAAPSGDHVTLRWILLHLVEEIARHNGHLDLLRELADGVKGD